MKRIGITTTVPSEVLLAAGCTPVDLNNILVTDPKPGRFIALAERTGFPLNCCAWIKGIYGVVIEQGIDTVLAVSGGDCSNTLMLAETLRLKGINIISFAFPDTPHASKMRSALTDLANSLGTKVEAAENARQALVPAREAARQLDEMTWRDNTVTGWENHLWLVSSSDFNGDAERYLQDVERVIKAASARRPFPEDEVRLGYIGVPAVFAKDLYPFLEQHGARTVYNEVQRQFSMPAPAGSLAEQYTNYTYPYTVSDRLRDIRTEIERRHIDGIIHYVQAFCHRGIADIIFRQKLGVPVLTLEGNADFFLNSHSKTRLEAFIDIIERKRRCMKTTVTGTIQRK